MYVYMYTSVAVNKCVNVNECKWKSTALCKPSALYTLLLCHCCGWHTFFRCIWWKLFCTLFQENTVCITLTHWHIYALAHTHTHTFTSMHTYTRVLMYVCICKCIICISQLLLVNTHFVAGCVCLYIPKYIRFFTLLIHTCICAICRCVAARLPWFLVTPPLLFLSF